MRIPKRFTLLNSEITVRVVSLAEWERVVEALADVDDLEGSDGAWRFYDRAIVLRRLKKPLLFQSYTHELIHAILDTMDDKRSYDEKWVEQFSGLLAQALETAE